MLRTQLRRFRGSWYRSRYRNWMPRGARARALMQERGYTVFRIYNERYANLSTCIARLLKPQVESIGLSRPVRILDLGCGMLWTTQPLLEQLSSETQASFDAHLSDIDEQAANYVQEVLRNPLPWCGIGSFEKVDALARCRLARGQDYDIVMAINMLFYLSRDKRSKFYENIQQSLSYNGTFLVSVRDREAEFWRIFDSVLAPLKGEMATGLSGFASMFQEEIEQAGMKVETDTNTFLLSVPFGDDFLRIIEFLYRLPPGRLMKDIAWRTTIRKIAMMHNANARSLTFSFQDRILLCRRKPDIFAQCGESQ